MVAIIFSERVQGGGPGKISVAFREITMVKSKERKIQPCGRLAEARAGFQTVLIYSHVAEQMSH